MAGTNNSQVRTAQSVGTGYTSRKFSPIQPTQPSWTAKSQGMSFPATQDLPGMFAETGQASVVTAQRTLSGAAGSFVETGETIALSTQRAVVGVAGAITETGKTASVLVSRRLSAVVGALAATGFSGAFGDTFGAFSGTTAWTGEAASLAISRKLLETAGALALSGEAATLAAARTQYGAAGAHLHTGNGCGLLWSGHKAAGGRHAKPRHGWSMR